MAPVSGGYANVPASPHLGEESHESQARHQTLHQGTKLSTTKLSTKLSKGNDMLEASPSCEVRGADGGIKPGVSASEPRERIPIDSRVREAADGP